MGIVMTSANILMFLFIGLICVFCAFLLIILPPVCFIIILIIILLSWLIGWAIKLGT